MSIGAVYKDPRTGGNIRHIAGELTFRRVGQGIVEVTLRQTYKLMGELAFSYRVPVHKIVSAAELTPVMDELLKKAEELLEPLKDLTPGATSEDS